MHEKLLTVKQAANRLKLSVHAVYGAIYRKALFPDRKMSLLNVIRISEAEIDRYRENRLGGPDRKPRKRKKRPLVESDFK